MDTTTKYKADIMDLAKRNTGATSSIGSAFVTGSSSNGKEARCCYICERKGHIMSKSFINPKSIQYRKDYQENETAKRKLKNTSF